MLSSIEVYRRVSLWTRDSFNQALSYAAGWGAVLLWASAPVLFKRCAIEAPLPYILVLRFALSLSLLPKALFSLSRSISRVPFLSVTRLFLWLGFNFYFQSSALSMLPASIYVIVFSLVPLLSLVVLRLGISRLQLVLSGLAACGCFLLLENGINVGSFPSKGLIFLVVGMLGWVFFTREFSSLQSSLPDFELSALTHVGMLLVSSVWWVGAGIPVASFSRTSTIALMVLGLSSPLAFYLFSYALRRTKAFAILSQYCEPAFSVLLASAFLGETLSPCQWAGALLILLAVLGTTSPTKEAEGFD